MEMWYKMLFPAGFFQGASSFSGRAASLGSPAAIGKAHYWSHDENICLTVRTVLMCKSLSNIMLDSALLWLVLLHDSGASAEGGDTGALCTHVVRTWRWRGLQHGGGMSVKMTPDVLRLARSKMCAVTAPERHPEIVIVCLRCLPTSDGSVILWRKLQPGLILPANILHKVMLHRSNVVLIYHSIFLSPNNKWIVILFEYFIS